MSLKVPCFNGMSRNYKNFSAVVSRSRNDRPLFGVDIGSGFARASWKWMVEGRAIEEEYSAKCVKGIWMSRVCYQLMEYLGFDPDVLNRKGKVIRDLAIERGWDQDKFDGFDQPLLDRVSGFYTSSNDAFARQHWGVAWNALFPVCLLYTSPSPRD